MGNEDVIRKNVMSIKTDNTPINQPKNKDTTLFYLYCLFANDSEKLLLSKKYDSPGLRYGDVKLELFQKIMDYFAPYQRKKSFASVQT